jgi:glycosyltransferase involved in cell wall biosynthesis
MTTVDTLVDVNVDSHRDAHLDRSSRATVSIVIPVYNESEILDTLFSRLCDTFSRLTDDFEVVLVDDASSDGSFEIMEGFNRRDPRFKVVRLARNFGHQVAITAGLLNATGDAVAIMDADLQDPPEVVEQFITHWREGWDVVYAVRRNRKENRFKRAAYYIFYRMLHRLARIDIPPDSGDFCLMDRHVVNLLNRLPERNRFLRGLRSWAGFRQMPLPYDRDRRLAGEPKYTLSKLVRLAADGVISFSYFPLQLGAVLGGICAALSFVAILIVLYFRLFTDRSIPGFAATAIITLFLGGVQMLVLGTMGAYIGRIYDEVKQRPLFVLRERVGFES